MVYAAVCLAGAVDNVADPGRCNPKVPSSIPIFEQSLNTGDLPAEWTLANGAPIFKKGSKLQAVNYRPVFLVSYSNTLYVSIF